MYQKACVAVRAPVMAVVVVVASTGAAVPIDRQPYVSLIMGFKRQLSRSPIVGLKRQLSPIGLCGALWSVAGSPVGRSVGSVREDSRSRQGR